MAERSQQLAVERTAPKTLPTSLIEDLRETEKAVLQVEAQARDYKPTYTGPMHGRVAEWISDPLGYTSDEEYRWSIGIQSLNNRYIARYMGATVPPRSLPGAKAVLINRTDTPKAVRQKLRVMEDELRPTWLRHARPCNNRAMAVCRQHSRGLQGADLSK